jgi:acyl-CoA thioester hydrolase
MSARWPSERLELSSYPGPGIDLPVMYADLDTNGHLNNVALGRFFEHARAAAFAGTGFWHAVHSDGGFSVVARVAIDYLREVHMGSALHVRSRISRVGTSSATVEQAAWRNGEPIGLAEVVFVHTKNGSAAPWSEAAVAVLREMGAG